jgi:hypothetical protein
MSGGAGRKASGTGAASEIPGGVAGGVGAAGGCCGRRDGQRGRSGSSISTSAAASAGAELPTSTTLVGRACWATTISA